MQVKRDIILSPAPFLAPRVLPVAQGLSVRQIIDQIYDSAKRPPICRDYDLIVEIDGEPIGCDRWHIIPAENAHVLVFAPVRDSGGGKDPLRTLLSIAVVVAAISLGQLYGAEFAASLGVSGKVGTAVLSLGITTAGSLLVNAIFPVRVPELSNINNSYNDSPTYSISGAGNQANPWGPIPAPLGRHLHYPPYGTKPYTEILGNDEYVRMLFVWGYGPLKIEDLKIGKTPLAQYSDYEIETREGWPEDEEITLIPNVVKQNSIGVELKQVNGRLVRTAEAVADELSVDISFPSGLTAFDSNSNRIDRNVEVLVEYRAVGDPDWITATTISATNQTTSAVRFGHRWTVDRTNQYEIALSRVTVDSDSTTIIDAVYWTNLRSFRNEHPVTFPYPLAMTALRIRASDQLQGMIDDLSGIVTPYVPVWGGDEWAGSEVSQNPAAMYRWVLMHPANALARGASQINDENLGEWYDFCVENGYKYNAIRDFTASVWETLADIAAAGRAAVSLIDGKWGVIMDTEDRPIVQHITPRNSWGFSAEKTLYDRPHAFRVKFKNEDQNFEWDERIVHDDGYNESNATRFESLEFPGVTHSDLIWKFGRYHIAQARLRPETYSLYMDFEHLACRRGSKVRVSHDIPEWGNGWGRVKSLIEDEEDPTKTAGVILDERVIMVEGTSYACRFRLADEDNTSLVLSVVNEPGETATLMFQTSIPAASGPQAGDLAMFGEAEEETVELLVKSIERASEFTARLILVDVAPEIYDADTGDIPEFNTHITQPTDVTKIAPPAPSITGIQSGTSALEIFNGGIRARMLVSVFPGSGGSVKVSRYRIRYRPIGTDSWSFADVMGNLTAIIADVSEGTTYAVQAQAISIYGIESDWSLVRTETIVGQGEVPSDVDGFACNIIGANAYLSWLPVNDIDLSHYRIRWTPELQDADWASSVDVVARVDRRSTSATVPAMVGTYLIKAVDYKGYTSETAAAAITNIARVSGLNFVESMEQPPWDGTGDGAAYNADMGGIILGLESDLYDAADLYSITNLYLYGSLLSEGFYELSDVIDLLDVFTVRVSAELQMSGQNLFSDLYLHNDLFEGGNLYGVIEGQYSASLEIRITQDDPESDPDWSAWKPFLVGDYTARAVQFRLKLVGMPPGITPIVYSVRAIIDMEDRVIGFSATVTAGGIRIEYDPAFYVAPEIGISVSDGQEGDKYTITNKDETGFNIAFTNGGSPVARAISGIAKAYGMKEAA
jgi:hypothetical protein